MACNSKGNQATPQIPGGGCPGKKMSPCPITDIALWTFIRWQVGRRRLLGLKAPALRVMVRPRDAVQWALYYPPILEYRSGDFPGETGWPVLVRQSMQFYRDGDLPRAFASLAPVPEDIREPRFFIYRAALLLTVGRVDDAHRDIQRALRLEPHHSHAIALQALIAVVQNDKDAALNLAQQAVELDPTSATARVALSYAQQAHFDLQGALASLQKAVQLSPENALAWVRLAELWLSVGKLKKATQAAQKAVALHPNLAHTQTVLGFAFLTQTKVREAQQAFAGPSISIKRPLCRGWVWDWRRFGRVICTRVAGKLPLPQVLTRTARLSAATWEGLLRRKTP